jgi:hypothetical protein
LQSQIFDGSFELFLDPNCIIQNYHLEITILKYFWKITASIFPYKICYKKSTKGHFYLADVAKMNHVRGSGGGAQIRASHSQSDPVSLGKVCVF